MKPTDDLREEHRAVKLMLRILDGVCTNIESQRSVKQENLEELQYFTNWIEKSFSFIPISKYFSLNV